MRKTKTEYFCDSCGNEVRSRRELHGFRFESLAPNGTIEEAVKADLCASCEEAAVKWTSMRSREIAFAGWDRLAITPRMTIRSFKPRERCLVNGYLVEIERHARRTTFARVLDVRLPGRVVVQLDKRTAAAPLPTIY